MEDGWLYLWRLYGFKANVTLERVLVVCSWPPPALVPVPGLPPDNGGPVVPFTGTPSVSPAAAIPADDTELAAGFVRVDENGYPVGAVGPPAANGTGKVIGCASRRVNSFGQLQQAVVQLQNLSAKYVVVRLVKNVSLADETWEEGLALRVFRNVTLIGRLVSSALVR